MADYKSMYHKLLCSVIDTIDNLQQAVLSAEEMYISKEEPIIDIVRCRCKEESENSSQDEE